MNWGASPRLCSQAICFSFFSFCTQSISAGPGVAGVPWRTRHPAAPAPPPPGAAFRFNGMPDLQNGAGKSGAAAMQKQPKKLFERTNKAIP